MPYGVVAFPGGKGTQNMIEQAEKAGVKVWRPIPDDYKPKAIFLK